MPQYAYPTSDVSNDGWATAPLWSKIDEEPANDDTDYVSSPLHANNRAYTVALGDVGDPSIHTGHILSYRLWGDNPNEYFKVELLQGVVVIHSTGNFKLTPANAWVTYSFTLTEGEAAAITDYLDLNVRLTAGAAGAIIYRQYTTWIRLEVPDVSKVRNLKVKVSGVWTPVVAVKVKVSGAWVPVKVSARVNGEWKTIHEN